MAQREDGTVVDQPERDRFELETAHGTAVLTYSREDGRMLLLHTEVPPEARGGGLGGRLVRAALDAARTGGLKVVPFCPFVKAYLERHPGDEDLVAG